MVRRGEPTLDIGVQQVKLSALMDEAGKLVCDQVLKGLEGVVNGVGEGLSHVVLAGGGAPLYERYVRAAFESPSTLVDVAEKPILSNAYGFWQSALSAHQLLGAKEGGVMAARTPLAPGSTSQVIVRAPRCRRFSIPSPAMKNFVVGFCSVTTMRPGAVRMSMLGESADFGLATEAHSAIERARWVGRRFFCRRRRD